MKAYKNKIYLSVIIPIFNEDKNIIRLHREIVRALSSCNIKYEIIYINDGSTDTSSEKLCKLKSVTVVTFRKNYGQTAALSAGIETSSGEVVATLDGDGQNDPDDICKLLLKLNDGWDVVCGWRKNRHDTYSKKLVSKIAYYFRSYFIKDSLHDYGCTLRVYSRDAARSLLGMNGEIHRFIPVLLNIEGYNVAEIEVNHRDRFSGNTKYNYTRIVRGFIDFLGIYFWYKFSSRPLHLFGFIGLSLSIAGLSITAILFILRLLFTYPLNDKVWPLVSVFLTVSGIQFFVSGIILDVLVKQYYSTNNKSFYKIDNVKITK
ncbi:glycosyltransferase family 2 protein [Candidatus Woesebacteria bacterium]|nr:MAG: glycosyltransferase family 2 protein [Candidatus Woesebacteria bacterium]